MLLSVIQSESDDENPRRRKVREFSVSFVYFLWYIYLPFLFLLSSTFFGASSYSSSFCSCNLDRWPESSSLLFKLISIRRGWFLYCYYFPERFSFLESFDIRSSIIRNNVIRMKCWMKQRVNQSNMKTVLDEQNFAQFSSNPISLHRTWFFAFFFVPLTDPIFHPIRHFCYVRSNVGSF